MITPRFTIEQCDATITIKIRAPYCDLKEFEVSVDGNDFRFFCKPYYLRLNLPGEIMENDRSKGQFDSDTGEFILNFDKANNGEYFENLDMLTSLLAPSKTKKLHIETLGDSENLTDDDSSDEWYFDQTADEPDEETVSIKNYKYGFALTKDDLSLLKDEFKSFIELESPNKTSYKSRRKLRIKKENSDLSIDHYLADMFDNEALDELLLIENPWETLNNVTLSDQEKDTLKDFANREYILSEKKIRMVNLGLLDILYAYCYDKRINAFESNCESPWNINKVSPTLSWFDVFKDERELLIALYRRTLIYPLYRRFELSQKVLQDMKTLFKAGRVQILKSLLDTYEMFQSSYEARYILNELYIKDYIIYFQKCDFELIKESANSLFDVPVQKADLDLNLNKWEKWADLCKNAEESDTAGLENKLASINLNEGSKLDSDDESSED